MDQIIEMLEQTISQYEKYAEEDDDKKVDYEEKENIAMSYFMDGRATTYRFAIRDLKQVITLATILKG